MNGSRARIVLINDDTTFLDLMRDLLQEVEGYEVLICKEGDRHMSSCGRSSRT